VVRNAREVWAPSAFSQSEIRRWFGRQAEHMPFCFDSDRFNREAGWRPPTGTPVVLSISRLAPHKNHAALVRAAALLPMPAHIRIIGIGSEAAALRSLASGLGVDLQLEERWLADDEVVSAYLGANVVVCPSRFEGIGVTPLEAIAMGIPTVASDIPPHREFVGRRGTLVPLDDDPALAHAISAALARRDNEVPEPPEAMTIPACAARLQAAFEGVLRAQPGETPR
jgi:glycosyltransferase involved in cell wall biosynthesis